MKALYILADRSYDLIYGQAERDDIAEQVDILAEPLTPEAALDRPDLLAETEIIFSGWGGPTFDEAFLDATPNLRAVFYGAGSIRSLVTEAFWKRRIVICSAWAANAVPVAEYTLSQVLWGLKQGWQLVRHLREGGAWWDKPTPPGAYGTTVGLISLGMIGRRVAELLQPFDVRIVAYDPFVDPSAAAELGIEEMLPLERVFAESDVVSLHTPNLPETRGLITGALLASMKPRATFINTARGAVVREEEMIDVLRKRPDLQAVLDVTHPEPPQAGSPLYSLPNVALTPHIAGSMGAECNRMGRYMVEELRRFCAGQPRLWQVDEEMARRMA